MAVILDKGTSSFQTSSVVEDALKHIGDLVMV